MSILTSEQIKTRYLEAREDIISMWVDKQEAEKYYLQCPCMITCPCDLDKFSLEQPFRNTHGFHVGWYCGQCRGDLINRIYCTVKGTEVING